MATYSLQEAPCTTWGIPCFVVHEWTPLIYVLSTQWWSQCVGLRLRQPRHTLVHSTLVSLPFPSLTHFLTFSLFASPLSPPLSPLACEPQFSLIGSMQILTPHAYGSCSPLPHFSSLDTITTKYDSFQGPWGGGPQFIATLHLVVDTYHHPWILPHELRVWWEM